MPLQNHCWKECDIDHKVHKEQKVKWVDIAMCIHYPLLVGDMIDQVFVITVRGVRIFSTLYPLVRPHSLEVARR